MIEIKGLTKIYKSDLEENKVIAANDISYKFNDSGFYFVLGKSGCGKTTLLNLLAGLDNYDSGQILMHGDDIRNYTEKQLDEYRNVKIGIIFQQYNLLPDIDVYDNLRLVMELQEWDCEKDNRKEYIDSKIADILKMVGISGYEKRKINQLSGGEQQRVAIARTLLKSPDIIFADEPTGNLDESTGNSIMQLLKSLSKNYLIIMVSHDTELAHKYGDFIINMSDGQIKSTEELEKKNYSYTFYVETNKNTKYTFNNLKTKDMLNEIEKLFVNIESGDTLKICSINKHADVKEESTYFSEIERKNIKQKKLSGAYKIRFAFEYLSKRRIRLFFTTLVTALSMILLFFSLYISFYNKEEVILKYMEENNPSLLPVFSQAEYTDDFYVKHDKNINKGRFLTEKVFGEFSDTTNTAKCINEQIIISDNDIFPNATMIFCDDFDNINMNIDGSLPANSHEISVTDYIAKKMNVDISDKLEWQGNELIISGIIRTDYIEYQLNRKLNFGSGDDFFQFRCEYEYFAVYVRSELLYNQNQKDNLTLQNSDFLYQKKESMYFNSFMEIGCSSAIGEDSLAFGYLPSDENEVALSVDFLQKHSLTAEQVLGKKYSFKDIHSPNYNNYYSDAQNMYDYYSNGIIISGVVEADNEGITKEMYVHPDAWNRIIDDNNKHYSAQLLLLPQKSDYKNIVSTAKEESLMFNEPAVNKIVSFDLTVQKMKLILSMILIVVVTLNFILIGTFVNISINENRRNIGILRSLGVTMRDCMHIFSIEFFTIYLASIVIATSAVFIIINIINNFFSQGLNGVKYDIIKFNIIIYLVILVAEYTIGYISIRFPISKMKKQKPAETIRGNRL